MNFDLVLKIVMASAGVIGGIAGTVMNAKTLINMSNTTNTATKTNSDGTNDQQTEEV